MCRTILFCEDEGRGSVGKHDENRTENDPSTFVLASFSTS